MTDSDRREAATTVAVAAVAVAVWFWRAPFATQGLWAEDGRNWLQDAVEVGWLEAFGRADAGYYHFLPRVAGGVASWFPVQHAALVTWIVGALVVAWFAVTTFTASRTWITNPLARGILAVALVALPVHREESIGNVANLHFVMLFVGLVVLLCEPRHTRERANGVVVLVVLGLSTPITLALAPFAVWRVLRAAPRRLDSLSTAWGVGVLLQFVPILLVRPDRPAVDGASATGSATRFVTEVAAQNFFPTERAARVVGVVVLLVVATIVVLATRDSWRAGARERAGLLLAVPAIGLVVHSISSIGYGARPRYALFPALCLLWSVLAATETLLGDTGRERARTAFAVIGVALAVAWVPQWSASAYRRSTPEWGPGVEEAARRCRETGAEQVEVVVGPTDLPPDRSWSVRLPCDELTSTR